MAGIKCSGSIFIVMLLAVSVVGKASAAATPNSWFSCMADCPKYNCQNPWMPDAACTAYCGTLCAIPPTNTVAAAADAVDRFCKLGCISSKCSTLSANSAGAEAVTGCIRGCSDICSSPAKASI